ncbi:uncharacterized protein LOC143370135 [Andrena cerasifolii]|uniref:uncharacterized protein LOC143370135 n=1 Tax=Andrena cerasifolii TaxID=2819439 RepID=UPI004037DD33
MDWGVRTVSLLLCLGVLLATIQHGYAERKIVCYYTNWSIYRPGTAKFSPQNINPYLCTHLIYAFGGFTKDNALKPFDKYQDIEKGGYAKFTGLKTYNKNLKTLLAIGGWNEGSSRFSPMVADAERRREFVKNSIKFLRKNHFDGLDLDWEYPAFRDGGKPRDKDNYASLVQELREEFERESSKTGRPRLLLSMAMPAGIEYIDKGYDVPRLNEYLDFINLLSYDYHSSYEPAVNHHSPLYPLEEDNEYNYDSELTIDYTVSYLLKMGASPDKIILGIPTYGRSYTLFNQDATDLGSPADGPGIEGDATREKGYLAYYEICDSLAASEDWEVVQPNAKAMGPYAFKEDQWVGYDDEDIVKLKAKYANEKELGGIMFWTIDNDDFRGKCHDRPYPLIEAAKEALLSKDTSAGQRSKPVNSRKKTRLPGVQSNTVGRKLSSGGRRTTTTAAPATRKRVSTPRPKFRTFSRSKASDEEDDELEVDRRSYEPSSDEEEDSDRGNVVRSADNADRSRNKGKSRPKARPSTRHRNKLTRRKNENSADSDESLSNKLTTPEPPTTPDPGTDFKCEDEGFFSHPRDCKKYFWCLDSGPGGLGVVAHQFTCPSGLVFNKAADSCDYPRNVVCPKSKASQSAASTTRAPITAATSRTTYLYSTTRKPSTEKPDLDEEYEEEYDDEEDVEEEEEKEEPKTTTTPKPLLYKTITRSRPTTTTTTTTETPATTTSKPASSDLEKVIGLEDEEDPKVIKELIKLIKKAGGIEQLEKHLSLQNKSPDESSSDKERATPATISRTLYERVLSRQAGKTAGTNFANGPGGAQFEGLDDVPEVKNLRRLQKPQYVTIERPKPSTKEPPVEEEDEGAEEELDDDNEDVASSEEQAVSNPFLASSTQRATPNYINIRRARPSATTSRNENDVDEKDEDEGEEVAIHPQRPGLLSRSTESNSSDDTKEQESRSTISEDNSSTTKFRYVSVQRFRSTTPKFPVTSETTSTIQEPVTESASSSETPEFLEKSEVVTTTPSTTVLPSTTPSTTIASNVVLDTETEKEKVPPSPSPEASSTTEAVKLVEDSATEILLTTAAASLSTLSSPSTRAGSVTVSQPRPFGFSRRNRPSTDATTSTTPLPSSSEQARPKVASSEAFRLPTLKELIGPRTNRFTSPSPVHLSLLPFNVYNEILPRDKHANLLLQGDDSRGSSRDREPWSLSDGDQSDEKRDELDLIGGKASEYYVEDNTADGEGDALSSRRRIDREYSSTTTLKPTTMRGAPLVNLRQNQSTRGFYVTKSEGELLTARKTDSDSATKFTAVLVETREQEEASTHVATTLEASRMYKKGSNNEGTSSATTMKYTDSTVAPSIESRARSTTSPKDQEQTEAENGLEGTTTALSTTLTTKVPSLEISATVPVILSPPTNSIPRVTSTFTPPTDYKPSTTKLLNETSSRREGKPSTTVIPVTTTVFFNNITDSSTIESTNVPPLTAISGSTFDTSADMQFDSPTKTPYSSPPTETVEPVTEAGPNTQKVALDLGTMITAKEPAGGLEAIRAALEENTVTQSDEGRRNVTTNSTTLASITKRAPTTIEESTEAPVTKSSRHRKKTPLDSRYKFGERSVIRAPTRHDWKLTTVDQGDRANQVEKTSLRRHRVPIYRGQRRRPVASSTAVSNTTVPRASTFNQLHDHAKWKANVSVASVSEEERDREKGNRLEVNSTTSSVASPRTPGSALWTRSRKPAAFSSSPSHSTSTTVASYKKNRPIEGNSSTVIEKPDATDEVRETPKAEKESDLSGRAQEIAVTLAKPPTPHPPATGRPSFRNPLRRRISTTLAPRTDATTSRSTPRDRQKPRAKDNKTKVQQNVTSRPRRPLVIDYDYYEDEEEPVVGKSSFNGKLFLTSKGTFRCLDQGNFPHPYSCKKFITCARMVNGLVTGAEYSCPDKLSFDPVGGICNWSAGLGCKD